MFSDKRGPEADHAHEGGPEQLPEVAAPAQPGRLVEERADTPALPLIHHSITNAPTRTKGAAQFSKRRMVPAPRQMITTWIAQKIAKDSHMVQGVAADVRGVRPAVADQFPGEEVDRLAADPGLDAEPAARHERPYDGGGDWRRAPRKEARANTGKGMPYLGPACPVSSIGTSTMRLARAMVNTACFQSMPTAISPEARVQDAVLGACRPTGRRSCTWSRVRPAAGDREQVLVGVGAAGRGVPGASSTRPSGGVTWPDIGTAGGAVLSLAGQSGRADRERPSGTSPSRDGRGGGDQEGEREPRERGQELTAGMTRPP